ncbi:MAG: proline--tRNA ligase, partial [Thermodesulfobacteriota bacterium]
MRYSQSFIPTLKETPAEAEVMSHKLMLRGGFIRKLASGVYTYLPLGLASIRKFENIIRKEMEKAGAQEVLMPMVQPADLWRESGRWQKYGPELLRFKDRHERQSCLGPTHEEVITDLIRHNIHSYRSLPLNLYQIQTKFRDEIRPRFGLMRGREFIMKDGYSFDVSDEEAEKTYQKMKEVYNRIFRRCGLKFRAVEADTGSIGGSYSHEFMILADTGEDIVVTCTSCSYAANLEKARAAVPPEPETRDLPAPEKVETPGKRKVATVCDFLGISPKELVKTMVYIADGKPVAVLIRGDHEVQEAKLKNALKADDIRMAQENEIYDFTGVATGYLGPVNLDMKIIADLEVAALPKFSCGANEKNHHLLNVNLARDLGKVTTEDLRTVTAEDSCPLCKQPLNLTRGIEVGHIFKLGTTYSKALKATFLDDKGRDIPFVMGCYGIGVSRLIAAAIEQSHDKDGMIFPMPIAPLQVVILNLGIKDESIDSAAEFLYNKCQERGIDTLLDDRDERPGIKFKDSDLTGIPLRVTVGKNFARNGLV